MTDEERDRLGERLLGTCESIQAALDFLEIEADAEAAEDKLLDISVELCKGCGWWHESCELDNERDGEVGYCDQCVPPQEGVE